MTEQDLDLPAGFTAELKVLDKEYLKVTQFIYLNPEAEDPDLLVIDDEKTAELHTKFDAENSQQIRIMLTDFRDERPSFISLRSPIHSQQQADDPEWFKSEVLPFVKKSLETQLATKQ